MCSSHFVDGASTAEHPDPELNLGHNLHQPTKRRVLPERKSPSPKRRKRAPVQDPGTEDKSPSPASIVIGFSLVLSIVMSLYRKVKADNLLLIEKNIQLTRQNNKLTHNIAQLHNIRKHENAFSYSSLKNDKDVSFFTGIPTLHLFEQLHNYISPLVNRRWKGYRHVVNNIRRFTGSPKRFGPPRKMLSRDEFCLTLMKLRLGSLYKDLAGRFCVSTSLASQVFHSWLTAMAKVLGHLIWFAPKDHISGSKPKRFNSLPDIRSIVDASEIFIETPKNPKLQCSTYSSYKHHNTAKFLIACAPNSCITYISPVYGGRATDKEITMKSGFLDMHEPYDMILADKGFNIANECAARRLTLYVPPGKRGQAQMSALSVKKTKLVANLRILIEQVIRRLKIFRILSGEVPLTVVPHLHKVLTVCAAISNMRGPIYKK